MKLFFRLVRMVLTPPILFLDWITTPRGIARPPREQEAVDAGTRNLTLYQFRACPFCIKVRRAMKRLSLNIETRDAQKDGRAREELLQGGGKIKVPCLKVTDEHGNATWMYESSEIIGYLRQRFAQ